MLVTFSGLDGAGKSTIIARLRASLEARGRKVTVLTMYDDVGVYAWIRKARDRLRRRAPAAKGGGAARVVSTLRSARTKRVVYLVDLVAFLGYRLWIEGVRRRVLVLDRYFYDSLADVADGRRWGYVRFFLKLAPTPTAPILVDTSPEESYKRKGEYSVEHLARRRAVYHEIFRRVRRPVIVPNERLEDTVRAIEAEVLRRIEGTA
jgi:thymidylate kinase